MSYRNRPFILLLVLVAITSILAGASLVAADTKIVDLNTTMPLMFTSDNPCTLTPEVILFEGFSHLHVQQFLAADNRLRIKIWINGHAMGKDAVSKLMYVLNAESHSDSTISVASDRLTSITQRAQGRIISQGPQDNFFLTVKVTFDPVTGAPGPPEIEKECRG